MKKDIVGTQNAFDLTGRVCVVVGAGLIGGEFARRCAFHGATVVVADLDNKKGEALAAEIGATFIACDATNEAEVKKLAAQVQEKFGRVDGVVNATYPKITGDFAQQVGTHTGAQFFVAEQFGELMAKQGHGSIVLVGSIYGSHAPRFELYTGSAVKAPPAAYAAAKGGLIALTRYLAKYYRPRGVRVNLLSPGGVEDAQDDVFQKKYSVHALDNRMAEPGDLSPALVYLFADASRYVTGQDIVTDGGWTL